MLGRTTNLRGDIVRRIIGFSRVVSHSASNHYHWTPREIFSWAAGAVVKLNDRN